MLQPYVWLGRIFRLPQHRYTMETNRRICRECGTFLLQLAQRTSVQTSEPASNELWQEWKLSVTARIAFFAAGAFFALALRFFGGIWWAVVPGCSRS